MYYENVSVGKEMAALDASSVCSILLKFHDFCVAADTIVV